MARLTGPDAADRLCYSVHGDGSIRSAAALTAVVYADAGGAGLANILTEDGDPVADSELSVDDTSLLPLFQYPDGQSVVYVSVSNGPISAVRATIAPVASVAGRTGAITLAKADVGLSNVDNTADASKPVSTAAQTALDAKAPLASPTFTGTVSGVSKTMVGLSNVDNTADASKPVSTAAQTALDLKAPLASPTFTGTVSGITKTMVGLGSVDNTADTAKPVSTATQTALDAKAAGAASSTDTALARFSGTAGKTLLNSGITVDTNQDMSGLRRTVRALGTDPAVAGLDRIDITYAVSSSSSDMEQLRVNNTTVSWRNEVGFLRGTPHSGYKDDALVRAVQRSDLTTETGSAIEIQNSARTQIFYGRRWRDGVLMRGTGSAAAVAMADVYVTTVGASLPSGLPSGTVVVRT